MWTLKPQAEHTVLLNVRSVTVTHAYHTHVFSLQESATVLNIRGKKKLFILWNMIGGDSSAMKYMPEYLRLRLQCCRSITLSTIILDKMTIVGEETLPLIHSEASLAVFI